MRANSRTVDVQDGDRLLKGIWSIDPAVALDVYSARITTREKVISFITDVDAISFAVQPGRTYDLILRLGGEHDCRTRISTLFQAARRMGAGSALGPPVLPFALRRGKLHLQGRVNGSAPLDLLFDTGADTNVLYPSALAKGARLRLDGSATNTGTGGTTERGISRDNRLELGELRWEHAPVLYVEKQADAADGIVGYTVFEDRVIEIDYDRGVLIVHDTLPPHAGFARVAMAFAGSLTAVEAILGAGGGAARGEFVLDTGGTGTLMVHRAFAAAHGLPGPLERLGTSRSAGVGSEVVRNEVALLPELALAGFKVRNVPVHFAVAAAGGDAGPEGGALCTEVLSRFNTLLDYPRHAAYFRPNKSFGDPFETRSWGSPWPVLTGIAVLSLASLAVLVGRALRSRRQRRA